VKDTWFGWVILALAASTAAGQTPSTPSPTPTARPPVVLDLPLLDHPFNLDEGSFPSMSQSVILSKDFYQLAHEGIARTFGRDRHLIGRFTSATFDFMTIWVPLGEAWVHEEWHRAVMSRRGVSSVDDIDHFPFFRPLISVSHVSDDDLVRLKAEHPDEFVRLPAAGIEGEYALAFEMEKDAFFTGSGRGNRFVWWLCKLGPAFYLQSSASDEADTLTDDANRDEGADVPRRDFTGMDFTGWAYDLFRPDEPYAARGIHPSGVGLNRYRRFSDLTAEEQAFLERQAGLTWLNLVDPQLFGRHAFRIKSPFGEGPLRFNFSLGHKLTSFGYDVDANVLLHQSNVRAVVILSAFVNHERWFPGLQAQLVRLPLPIGDRSVFMSPRLALWLQPEDQQFRTRRAQPGGLLGLRLAASPRGRFEPYLEVEGKTRGWVAGNVYLGPNLSARVGLTTRLF
jgi:hypothetical protein